MASRWLIRSYAAALAAATALVYVLGMSLNLRIRVATALACCLGAAQAQVEQPPRPGDAPSVEIDEGGNFLIIPGIGKIPMPPGARAFGPGNPPTGLAPRGLGPESARPAPEPPKSPEQKHADNLARLFDRLAGAEDEREAESVSATILKEWRRSGSDTIDLLSARAAAAQVAGEAQLARSLLDYVVALAPYWPEGFVQRARLRAAQDDVAGAIDDLDRAARLEPKRFDAFAAIGALAEKFGDKKKALDSYRKALAISPRQDTLRRQEERLKVEVEGRDI